MDSKKENKFKNTVRLEKAGDNFKLMLFVEFNGEVLCATELATYSEEDLAEKHIKWFEDGGVKVERISYEGMTPYDDSQYH